MENDLFWFENVEQREHPWPGLNWLTATISLPDVKQARDAYVKAFGFVSIYDKPNSEGGLATARLRYRGANVLLTQEGTFGYASCPAKSNTTSPLIFYVYVDDTRAAYDRALSAGFTSLEAPYETPWGDMCCRVQCPWGYMWDLAHKI